MTGARDIYSYLSGVNNGESGAFVVRRRPVVYWTIFDVFIY